MTEEYEDLPETPLKRKTRRTAVQIEADIRARIMAELASAGVLKDAKELVASSAQVKAAADIAAVEMDINKKVAQKANMPAGRVWIILQENPAIQRGQGQFFGINGMGFLLRPGKKAYVPQGIVDILENAVEEIPDVDPDTLQVVGWRKRLRYPYSIVAPPVEEAA